jgi:hypothetical protein
LEFELFDVLLERSDIPLDFGRRRLIILLERKCEQLARVLETVRDSVQRRDNVL